MSELLLKDKLRQLRISKHFTQNKIAQFLNMTRQGYAHYEAGSRNPDYHTLLKLSQLYNIDINALINNQTPIIPESLQEDDVYCKSENAKKSNTTTPRIIPLSNDAKRLISLYNKLTKQDKKELLAWLEKKINDYPK